MTRPDKKYYWFGMFIMVTILFSCEEHSQEYPKYGPKVVEAKGYVVPKDSLSKPNAIPFETPRIVPALKREVEVTRVNLHPIVNPKIVLAGEPKVCTPGEDNFSLPQTDLAINRSVRAGLPKSIPAKETYTIDLNPQNFSSFNKLQGLNHSIVRSIFEDSNGNLWLGTDGGGISKYDGKNLTTFTQNEGLGNDIVSCIQEDSDGNIWLGTWGGGVSKYDGNSFTNYTKKEGLGSNHIFTMLVDRNENVWIGSWEGGVTQYNGAHFTHFKSKEGLGADHVLSIIEDNSGHLWFGTDGGGVSKYDGASFENYTVNEGLGHNVITCMTVDVSGNIWFGTQGGGVSKYDGKTFTNFNKDGGLPSNFVFSIIEDSSHNLWLGTWGGGVTKYDGGAFTHYPVLDGLQNEDVLSIQEDRNGNLWFGTNGGGVSKYNGQGFIHFSQNNGLAHNDVRSITEDKVGNLWIGTNGGGVSKYDGEKFTHITEKDPGYTVLNRNILEDKNGNLWLASWAGGVVKYDGENFTHFNEMKEINRCRVMAILEDQHGNLWFGTDFGGVVKYNGEVFTQFTVKEGLSNNIVTCMEEDKSGHLWFGTKGGGVTKYDGENFTHFTTQQGLAHNNVLSILRDKDGNLWFGTEGGGVSRYDGKFFTHFTENEGLVSNKIRSIFQDKKGILWFGSDMGLSKLKTAKAHEISRKDGLVAISSSDVLFLNYTYEDGFLGIGVNAGKTIHEDRNGLIWVGAKDRLAAFDPSRLKMDTIAPNLQLTNLELFNESIPWADLMHKKDTSLVLGNGIGIAGFQLDGVSKWHNFPKHLSLAYHNNHLTFAYVGTTLRSPQKVKYQYQLEGLEDNWSKLSDHTEAVYGNLPSGTFTFKVKAMNSAGVWSNPLHYTFTIRPPWWQTWWAYLCYILLVGGSGIALYQFQLSQSLQKAESLRLKELDFFKSKLYTNITHEFRTPLTVILGMANQVLDSPKEYVREGMKLIIRNGQSLLTLVNQMLDLSKLESGKLGLHYQQADIVAFLKYVVESFHSLAESKGIEIHLFVVEEHFTMDFDEMRLQQVISNLLSNAIKFTPKGGHIYISTHTWENRFVLKIKDTGMGIAEKDLPHIFERFYQSDTSHTRNGEGTGIGLELTRELVKRMEGTISVKSNKAKGVEFKVSLPIHNLSDLRKTPRETSFLVANTGQEVPVPDEKSPLSFLTSEAPLKDKRVLEKPMVLIADDNVDVRTYLTVCLKEHYTVEIAKNGRECENMALGLIPDLIVLDVMMPLKDGLEVCRTLKTEEGTCHIPIIMLTAKADMDSRLEGLGHRADDYLTKPFHKKELLLRIENLLLLRKRLQQHYRSSLEAGLTQGVIFKPVGNLEKLDISEVGVAKDVSERKGNQSIPMANSLDNAFVIKVRKSIEEHLDDPDFDVEKLCRSVALSHSQVHRKLSALTGLSATYFIRYVRLLKAKELIIHSGFTIAAIANDCGFSDPAYFSRVFKKEFGIAPQVWREQNSA